MPGEVRFYANVTRTVRKYRINQRPPGAPLIKLRRFSSHQKDRIMFSVNHPLWLVGFRPFFLLGCFAGTFLPFTWVGVFSSILTLTASPVAPMRWHAHEMFFGFGWAILGGFLLTSTKNWVSIRGHHGTALAYLTLAWIIERVGMAFGSEWPLWLFLVSNNLFLGSIVSMLLWTLIRHRHQDSYRDNGFFIILLPIFLVAKQLMLHGDFAAGSEMTLALFRLAFLVMLERTLTQFMKGAFQVSILRHPWLDLSIKLLALILVVGFLLPEGVTATLALALACLLLLRLTFWHPQLGMRRIDIGIMYIGYLAIVGQLVLFALGSVNTHVFTFGAMGCIIPAMIVRIANGHTGRKVLFTGVDRSILYLMLAALFIRTVLPHFAPGQYLAWLFAAASCWFLAFGLLGWRYIPYLLQARVDGRTH